MIESKFLHIYMMNLSNSVLCFFGQTSIKLKRFLESLLQKSGKLRSLARDLRENYSSCSTTQEILASNSQKKPIEDLAGFGFYFPLTAPYATA